MTKLKLITILAFFHFQVIGLYAQVQSITVDNGIDAFVNRWGGNTNYGSHANNFAYTNTTSIWNPYILKSYIQFNLPSIPDGAIIESITLRMHQDAFFSQEEILISMVSSSWIESQITWNNQPSLYTGTGNEISFPAQGSSADPYYDYDITSIGLKWLEQGYNNYGVRFQLKNELIGPTKGYRFFSFNQTNTSIRPHLIIKYYNPIEVSGTVTQSDDNNGSITANTSGGTGSYVYEWKDGSGFVLSSTTNTISSLSDGFYTLKVTDGNGDYETQIFLVTDICQSKKYKLTFKEDVIKDLYLDNRYLHNYAPSTNILGNGEYEYFIIGGGSGVADFTSIIDLSVFGLENSIVSKVEFKNKTNSIASMNNSNIFLTPISENWNEGGVNPYKIFNQGYPSYSTNSSEYHYVDRVENGYDIFDLTNYFSTNKSNMLNVHGFKYDDNYGGGPSLNEYYKYYGSNNTTYPPELEITVKCPNVFAQLNESVGSDYYYQDPTKDKLKVRYVAEYYSESNGIQYKITDLNTDQTYTEADFSIDQSFGNNWIEFDLSSNGLNLTPNGHYYLLEVINQKNESSYLRFKY